MNSRANYCSMALCCGSAPCYIGRLESLRRLRDALQDLDVGNEVIPAPVFVGYVDGTEIVTGE